MHMKQKCEQLESRRMIVWNSKLHGSKTERRRWGAGRGPGFMAFFRALQIPRHTAGL